MPNLQGGGGRFLNFAHFSMQFCNPGDPKGGHGPMAAPQYAPALTVVNLGTVCEWFALYTSI